MADHERDLGPDAPPTEQELKEARALQEALDGAGSSADAAFLRAVALAERPTELAPEVHERIVAGALAKAPRRRSTGRVVRVLFRGAAAFALAAGVAFALTSQRAGPPSRTAALAQSRSTQELFHEPFHGLPASARIDRIAMARVGDLRENRFARWGVR